MALLKIEAFVALILAGLLCGRGAAGDLPVEPDVIRQEAQEAFEDGRYEEVLRLCADVRRWVNVPANTKLLAASGKSWLAILGNLNELEARTYFEMGEPDKARTKIKLASDQMRQRRKFFAEQGDGSTAFLFWILEAKSKFLEGDLDRPVPDYGVSSGEAESLVTLAERVGNPKKALAKYGEAQRIIEGNLRLRAGLQGGGASLDPLVLEVNRLLIRLLVSESHARLWHHGEPSDGDIADAESFLTRAEELLPLNGWWQLFVAPDSPFPLAYRRFQEKAEENKRSAGSQSGVVNEETLIALKKLWGQAIDDYLLVMFSRAEVAAHTEAHALGAGSDSPSSKKYGVLNADRLYGRALNLLRQHYEPDHRKFLRAKMSRARWYVIISDPARQGEERPSDVRIRALASMARDCLLLVYEQRLYVSPGESKRSLELDYMELKALGNLRSLHAKWPCLNESQVREIEKRREELQAGLASLTTVR